jgi:hypothetical protein
MQGLRCLPALAAFALAGCGIAPGIFGNPPRYIDSPVYPKPRLEVLTTVIEVLERQGYRVQSVSEGRQIEAAKVRLSPFNKEGKRWKASVKLDSDVDGTVIHLMIEAEVNKNIQAPLDERGLRHRRGGDDALDVRHEDHAAEAPAAGDAEQGPVRSPAPSAASH